MELLDFSTYKKNDHRYGGDAGLKYGVEIDGGNWILKFPKSTRDMIDPKVSYTTSPLSEYIGSKIYESLDVPVHETMLGVRDGKVVVACKDFLSPLDVFIDFKEIKNGFEGDERRGSSNSGTGSSADLLEVLEVVANDSLLKKVQGVAERFWTMFVIDALIGNEDRNNTNWGLIKKYSVRLDKQGADALVVLKGYELAPVFDNGNALFGKRNEEQFSRRLGSENLMIEDAFGTNISFYKDSDGHHIHPFEYLKTTENMLAKNAVLEIAKAIDKNRISQIISEIPLKAFGIDVISESQKAFYTELMDIRRKGLLEIADTMG